MRRGWVASGLRALAKLCYGLAILCYVIVGLGVLAIAAGILLLVLYGGVGVLPVLGLGTVLLTGLAMVFSGVFTHLSEKAYNAVPELKCPACQYETRDGGDDLADHLRSSHQWTKQATYEWVKQAESLSHGDEKPATP
jgi:hypothetical protein